MDKFKILKMLICFCIVVSLFGCTLGNISSKKVSNNEDTEKEYLTMKKVADMLEKSNLVQASYSQFKNYKNCTLEVTDQICKDLIFDIRYKKKQYVVTFCFELNSNKLQEIEIENKETDENRYLYTTDKDFSEYVIDIQDFLSHEAFLEEQISISLPSGLKFGECYYDLLNNTGIGCLFIEKDENSQYIQGYSESLVWSALGGISTDDNLVFDIEKNLPRYHWEDYRGNGKNARKESVVSNIKGGELESVSDCDVMASIEGIRIEKEAYVGNSKEYAGLKDVQDKFDNMYPKRIWVSCIAKKDDNSGKGYILFFDADEYSKADVIKVIQSIDIN